ncbi:MAG: DUF1343 domain-containing protein [Bacteroidota bacterium]
MSKIQLILLFLAFSQMNCVNNNFPQTSPGTQDEVEEPVEAPLNSPQTIQVGAEQTGKYLPLLTGKNVAAVVNQSSTFSGGHHLIDSLQSLGVQLVKIFALEHGFRGTADAGASINDGIDEQSGLPIVSLYGREKEPSAAALSNVDVIVFDIQDVGARFYTYISSLHYILRGAAKNNTEVIILDRPNPNGHYVDGPILQAGFESFVGMHPVPVVHGMTIGEYGQMINGEGWLEDGLQARLTVIPCQNYTHTTPYELPIPPSPNLPNWRSILLYPSLCFFEGTVVSVGRGTNTQFQVYGHPQLASGDYVFTPRPGPGSAHPKLQGQVCRGFDLTLLSVQGLLKQSQLNLGYFIDAHNELAAIDFFDRPAFFDKLAGSSQLRQQISSGMSEATIRASWEDGLQKFRQMRKQYLLYRE